MLNILIILLTLIYCMSKKLINQNSNYNLEFLEAVESNFTFEEKPINRLKTDTVSPKTENTEKNIDKNIIK